MDWGTIPFPPPADEAILEEFYERRLRLRRISAADLTARSAEAHEALRPRTEITQDTELAQDTSDSARKGRFVNSMVLLPDTIPSLLDALSALLGENVNIPKLARLLCGDDGDACIRLSAVLYRARKGRPVRVEIVWAMALEFGIPVEELAAPDSVALNLAAARGGSAARDGFAEIRRGQTQDLLHRLQRFPVTMHTVETDMDESALLADLRDPAVDVEFQKRSLKRAASSSKRANRVFAELRNAMGWPSRISLSKEDVRSLVAAAAEAERVIRFGRLIRVQRLRPSDPLAPSTHYRCLRVDVAFAHESPNAPVDLSSDYAHRPTQRELALLGRERPVDGAIEREIEAVRADIEWCGHWEGRWLPLWPIPISERIRVGLSNRSSAL
ncbi:hypothetical protein [Falsiroseomonas sp. CW058]|uniref:hypothetical protein n=1 Tax=Falsiroseomonas sp. CW058 TaxID=3388664 RepID=UPI003D31811E